MRLRQPGHQFAGSIDDAQVWQRPLSARDVRDLATAPVAQAAYGLAEGAATALETGATGDEYQGN
ncbi:hypothetical protein [Actinokineospora globicatena]|uniref:hypothetical protein n=1 Tax=Actinokineospora globicatena TaxID=103729 RepID=UPI002554D3CC|nr:hypothetical protein [Actinokineospora globicatena]